MVNHPRRFISSYTIRLQHFPKNPGTMNFCISPRLGRSVKFQGESLGYEKRGWYQIL